MDSDTDKRKDNEDKKGIFFGIIGVLTLIVAIIGASFAYFSINARSETDALTVNAASVQIVYEHGNKLEIKDLIPSSNEAIQEISCTEIESLCTNFKIKKIYLTNYVLKEEEKNTLASSLKDYLNNLSDAGDYLKRLVIEYDIDNNSFYANIGVE